MHDELEIRLVVMWPDGSITCGADATDVLDELCGGWNPDSREELRFALAERCGIPSPSSGESDDSFIMRLVACGVLKRYDVQPDDWKM